MRAASGSGRQTSEGRLGSLLLRGAVYCSAAAAAMPLLLVVSFVLINGTPHLLGQLPAVGCPPDRLSLLPSVLNTLAVTAAALLTALPVGVGAAVWLSEYAGSGSVLATAASIAADTLSGIPSIVYGLFGSVFFVRFLGLGLSLLSGALTLSVMIFPLIMQTSQEALQSVPQALREGSCALGAGKARTAAVVILPQALPGIISGALLGAGRVLGESAALIFTAGTAAQAASLSGSGRTLAVHMYILACEGAGAEQCYAAAAVLLAASAVISLLPCAVQRLFQKG